MNSLSWLLYLADLAGNIRNASEIGLVLIAMITPIGVVYIGIIASEGKRPPSRIVATFAAASIFFTALFSMAAIVTPSPATVYMIAASEAGEAVATSPQARILLESLREIIARKLKVEIGEVRT